MTITPEQSIAARGLLRMRSVAEVAAHVGCAESTYKKFEGLQGGIGPAKKERARHFFENRGIGFIGQTGVNRRTQSNYTLQGRDGFWMFLDDVYDTVKDGGEIDVINVVDETFVKWAGEKFKPHIERMGRIKGLTCRTLAPHGYKNFVSTAYSQYKWLKEGDFIEIPFYIYGDKLAILILDPEPLILVIVEPKIAKAYRVQFMNLWQNVFEVVK
ncbi:MAG: hypothetical protein JKP92_08970 [Alphaproteobacteria bacterium]|jgi:hypothetical protein|nr:hypothetical protein [Alphaproteobacteria bacterium]